MNKELWEAGGRSVILILTAVLSLLLCCWKRPFSSVETAPLAECLCCKHKVPSSTLRTQVKTISDMAACTFSSSVGEVTKFSSALHIHTHTMHTCTGRHCENRYTCMCMHTHIHTHLKKILYQLAYLFIKMLKTDNKLYFARGFCPSRLHF